MTKYKIRKEQLKAVFGLIADSYRIIGPKIQSSVIVLAEIDYQDIPAGYKDNQEPGVYRLAKGEGPEVFSFSNGPDSFKRFLNPPVREIFTFKKTKTGIVVTPSSHNERPMAFFGIRACDIAALKLYDRIFSEDPAYLLLRRDTFIIALNCLYPGGNCFCPSIGTGPEVKDGFDICLTELDGTFLLEAGSARGKEILDSSPTEETGDQDIRQKASKIENCRKMVRKTIRFGELPWLIYRNPEHPLWADVARRDLECGNCTQVCPTCFCTTSYDQLLLSGVSKKSPDISGARVRKWDSCFSRNFARVHGGNFRPSRRARYRHWMSHKLAYTFEQFGMPGCVGCGRCITWCPVGIDITRELEALKGVR